MKILLVDDHAVVRAGIRRILEDELDAPQIGEATDAVGLLEQLRRERWDVLVLDISLPGRGGLDVLKEVRGLQPDCRVLVMTMYSEDQYAVRAFRTGAAGYLTKDSAPEELIAAIRKLCSGGKYVSASLAEKLATQLTDQAGAPLHEALSNRELQVLRMIAAAKSVKEIGQELSLSEKTISTYRTRVLEKLNLRTTAELIRYAIHAKLVD